MNAFQILDNIKAVQSERANEYSSEGSERSFHAVAVAFNAITGKDLTAAEVALVLQVLKDVRQWSSPNRLHEDSVLDSVSYAALKGEELFKQFYTSTPKKHTAPGYSGPTNVQPQYTK